MHIYILSLRPKVAHAWTTKGEVSSVINKSIHRGVVDYCSAVITQDGFETEFTDPIV